jgi:acyl-coenzyme A synthetase/AMP-(fatty) acid ligase
MEDSTFFHSLEGLPAQDRRLFNKFSRGSHSPIPYNVVHYAFEAVASANPSAIAIRDNTGTTITYRELDRRANILANELKSTYRVKKGDRVALVYSRCIEMVVFILATLKAGGQYVPLDGGIIPEEILCHDILDSKASVVLCIPKFLGKVQQSISKLRGSKVEVVAIDAHSTLWFTGDVLNPGVEVTAEDGAYIIYTSGTTGRPKGVDVRHRGITNTLLTEPSNLGITVGVNVAQQLNVGFDMCERFPLIKKSIFFLFSNLI